MPWQIGLKLGGNTKNEFYKAKIDPELLETGQKCHVQLSQCGGHSEISFGRVKIPVLQAKAD